MKRSERMIEMVFEEEKAMEGTSATEEKTLKEASNIMTEAPIVFRERIAVLSTPQAPSFSPITPQAPPFSPITPLAQRFAPITSQGCNAFNINNEPPENIGNSPIRPMTPETLNLYNELSLNHGMIFSDNGDDEFKDPDYVLSQESSDSSNSSEILNLTSQLTVAKSTFSPFDISLTNGDKSQQIQFVEINPNPLKRRASESDLSKSHSIKQRRLSLNVVPKKNYSFEEPLTLCNEVKIKKVADPSKWKRNIERLKRLEGKSYKTQKGKVIASRPYKSPRCLQKLNHKCNEKVPAAKRKHIYDSFRALKSLDKQREFIINHCKKEKKKRSTTTGTSRKEYTMKYTFSIDANVKVTVCREFFLDTLNISEGMVRGALSKISSEGVLKPDKRGKKPPPQKFSAEREKFIVDHIFSFPTMSSHYCRKNTEYKYLDSNLNIKFMHEEYKKKCLENGHQPACIEKYRKIFRNYKLKFHVPKKDLCKKCVAMKETNINESDNSEDFQKHLDRKNSAFLRRDTDKEAAKTDSNTLSFNFDLEAVLQTPKGAAGPFFYARKLAVYNLTIYNLGNQDVECLTWDETEGKRGSLEISTCIFKYISQSEGITHVRMMSDNCGGQQKNFNFCCMLLHAIAKHPTLQVIDHVFFESGHSHMECDSAHSKIEQRSKKIAVYTPDGWSQVMRLARSKPRPFNVTTLVHDDFLDFNVNQLTFEAENTKTKKKVTKNNQKILLQDGQTKNFQNAVWIQYRKQSPMSIFIKCNYDDEDFIELKMKAKRKKPLEIIPTPAYTARIPISKAKKNDLLKLCQDLLIPKPYHTYYQSLPVSDTAVDHLPEPDADED